MKRWFWLTAVPLIALLIVSVSCSSTEPEASTDEISGPAFVFFYTDN